MIIIGGGGELSESFDSILCRKVSDDNLIVWRHDYLWCTDMFHNILSNLIKITFECFHLFNATLFLYEITTYIYRTQIFITNIFAQWSFNMKSRRNRKNYSWKLLIIKCTEPKRNFKEIYILSILTFVNALKVIRSKRKYKKVQVTQNLN